MPYKKQSGIYKIVNTINNKMYIGSAISIKDRFRHHRRLLNSNSHFNNHLQAAWNKYGEEVFSFEILETTSNDFLIQIEQHWIDFYSVNKNTIGYNKRLIASTNLGVKASSATREKLRLSHLGHKRSKEAQDKITAAQYKPVCQISKEGKILNCFPSIQEALKCVGVEYNAGVSACLKRRIPSAHGYYWCYESDKNTFIPLEHKKRRLGTIAVQAQCRKTGKIFKYSSMTVAAKDLNISTGSISQAIQGKIKKGKYIWKKIENESVST